MDNELKILAIDDDEEILYALRAVFQFQGWTGITAADVPTGVKLFQLKKPDLVLIDYHLPQVSGIRGVEMIRELDADVPIIVFTIDESQEVAEQFIAAGASDFALKPLKVPDIISRIKLHIRLLENQKKLKGRVGQAKGIDASTLSLVIGVLERADEPVTVETVAAETGLANQTVYRYLQNLIKQNKVEATQSYGKVGRPKQKYSLIGE